MKFISNSFYTHRPNSNSFPPMQGNGDEFDQDFLQVLDQPQNQSLNKKSVKIDESMEPFERMPNILATISMEEEKEIAVMHPKKEKKAALAENDKTYSKDCLKLGRKLVKLFKKNLASSRSRFANRFLTVSAKLFNSVVATYGFVERRQEELLDAQAEVLQSVWEQLKNCLNYSKNKKICVVKSEYWDNVFSHKTFINNAKNACRDLDALTVQNLFLNCEPILNSFCDILYIINQMMVLMLILKDDTPKGGQFIRKIETLDNLIVLIINPKLFDFYNHRSGKFASECCGKCKICRSREVPPDIGLALQVTRNATNYVINTILQNCSASLEAIEEYNVFFLLALLVKHICQLD